MTVFSHESFADHEQVVFFSDEAELYPPAMRSTGVSIAYNLAVTVFGGFAPFITTWLIVQTGSALAPAWYVMLAAAISLSALMMGRNLLKESFGRCSTMS
ncbi:hypothetical protein [Bosea sp. NBC_00550]|uniref:hypothetical protein n=1 Tax=Bosea sp. NBC_00550 TaxID=2969621 RepID=UPI0022316318|nr:hypothetical protein [Bosea sp. NBC_00550]UZF92354.1 hypothetical protein NWE53_25420 [Bosea sp. NBC_00550]